MPSFRAAVPSSGTCADRFRRAIRPARTRLCCTSLAKTLDALATAEEKLAAVEAELEQLAAEFQALSLEQEKTIAQIDDVQTQIDETQEQIEEKQQELEDKQNVLAGRVSDSYKDGPGSTLKLLLAAKSFDELLSNSRYVEKINDADKQVISEIQQIRESLEQQKQNWSSRRPSWRPSGSSRPTSSPTCRPSKAKSKLGRWPFQRRQRAHGPARCRIPRRSRGGASPTGGSAAAPAERRGNDVSARQRQVSGSSRSQERVVSCCYAVPSPGAGYCAMWVSRVFAAAGFSYLAATPTTCTTAGARAPTRTICAWA